MFAPVDRPTQHLLRVARLQNEFSTKNVFRATKFLTENAPKFSPNFLSLYFVGQKNPQNPPAKLPAKFPSQKAKKITDELLQERSENIFSHR